RGDAVAVLRWSLARAVVPELAAPPHPRPSGHSRERAARDMVRRRHGARCRDVAHGNRAHGAAATVARSVVGRWCGVHRDRARGASRLTTARTTELLQWTRLAPGGTRATLE